MSVAHQPPAAIIGELGGMAAEQARNLGLDGLRQNRSRAVAQNLGQRIAKSSWLRELENISVGHDVSLLCWRSGGVEHPHDTPPYPFTPSPTFAHSSSVYLDLSLKNGCITSAGGRRRCRGLAARASPARVPWAREFLGAVRSNQWRQGGVRVEFFDYGCMGGRNLDEISPIMRWFCLTM